MSAFKEALKEMEFDFFGAGEHSMSVDAMKKALGNDHFFFLDVRSDKEAEYLAFPFATRIPLNELPDRLDEVPRDKFVVTFCSSVFRGALAYAYLVSEGYLEVKGMGVAAEDMVKAFKPGPLFNM